MRTVLILLLTVFSATVFAQTAQPGVQKIGYADWDYIFSQMPEYKKIDNELKTHGDQLQAQLKAKYSEYETKLKAYQASAATMVDAVRKDKEAELTQLQENIQKFQQDAQTSLQKKQELIKPLQDKVFEAVEKVAKQNRLAIIFDKSSELVMIYTDPRHDYTDFVLEELGLGDPNDKIK